MSNTEAQISTAQITTDELAAEYVPPSPPPRVPLTSDEPATLAEVFLRAARTYNKPDALNYKRDGAWHAISSAELVEHARYIAYGLYALGLRRGATHAEFIRSAADGAFYFLEIAARVGGAYIAETHEAATGINVWRDWAKIELADDAHPFTIAPAQQTYAGIALSLARQEWPDTSSFNEPEIAYRIRKPFHIGLVVRAANQQRVRELLDDYARRFSADFSAVAPPLERPE